MADKSAGQQLIERVEGWLKTYVVFPTRTQDASLVVALWIINTWIYQVWSSCPRLSIQAASSGAAKSVLIELVSFLAKNAELESDPTPAYLYSKAEAHAGWFTLCFDEAEKLSKETHPLRTVLNPGYREGATIGRRLPGSQGTIDYPVYWPACFALIGDLYQTLRVRSIVIPLERAGTARLQALRAAGVIKLYRPRDAQREASAIKAAIEAWVKTLSGEPFTMIPTPWVAGREEELWSPLWSLLHVVKADRATMDRFEMISNDLIGLRDRDASFYTDAQKQEDMARDITRGEQLVQDMAACFKEGERGLKSSEVVKRLHAMRDRPWRTYKGEGINEINLSDLVGRFNLAPAQLPRSRNEKTARGYRKDHVVAALKLVHGDE